MDIQKYIDYVLRKGDCINNDIHNNIYFTENDLLRLLLIDYITDTLDNYDYRNCPDYIDPEDPIIPEDNIFRLVTEDFNFFIVTEDGENYIVTENSYLDGAQRIIIDEDHSAYIESEGRFERYAFDKNIIENYLINLTKDISC